MSTKKAKKDNDNQEGSGTGSGGQGEGVQFRIKTEVTRDDLLSGEEKKNYINRHETAHLEAVKKQKSALDERKLVKENKSSKETYRAGNGMGEYAENGCRPHPILMDAAQFHATDKQVTALPNESEPNTNDELRNELQLRFDLTNRPQNVPRFNPQPIKR